MAFPRLNRPVTDLSFQEVTESRTVQRSLKDHKPKFVDKVRPISLYCYACRQHVGGMTRRGTIVSDEFPNATSKIEKRN
jgi:hypothetical protein